MKKISIFVVIASIVTSIIIASCGNNGCEQTREVYCLADLSSLSGAKINQLYAYGIGQGGSTDSVGAAIDDIMLSESSPTSLEFILNPDTTFTDIRLQFNITLDGDSFQHEDTLHFSYDAHPFFLDMECGCSVFFTLNEISSTNNFIRNVSIKRKEITNEENINIIIEY